MSEDSLYWLDQISPSHRAWVGDKAFYLGLLSQRGYSTIPGAVVSATVFQAFLEQIQWVAPLFADLPNSSLHIDVDNSRQLQSVAQQIQQAIQETTYSAAWLDQIEAACQNWQTSALILRPSLAIPSLNDPTLSSKSSSILQSEVCRCDRHAITQSLKQVWASLFRAKSLLYWQRLRIQLQQIQLAVLVQPMRSVLTSGEVQVQDHHLDVLATWGLGRALVQGEVIPDRFHLNLQTGAQSHHLGVKRYAYRIAAPDNKELNQEEDQEFTSATLLQTEDCYEVYPLQPLQQTQPVLNSSQIQKLVHLAQQIIMEIGTSLKLEWIYPDSSSDQSEPQIIQVNPHLGTYRWREEDIKVWQDQDTSTQTAPSIKSLVETVSAGNRTEPASRSSLPRSTPTPALPSTLTGLAAASGRITASAWVVPHADRAIDQIDQSVNPPPGSIIVASSITPDLLPLIKQASGIITEQGGMTSHGAILARELRIPAITGVSQATHLISTGAVLVMDGDRGEIELIRGDGESSSGGVKSGETFGNPAATTATDPQLQKKQTAGVSVPIATQLWVTLSQTSAIAQVMNLPIDGVGLLRSELMLLEVLEQRHPSLWIAEGHQEELIRRIVNQVQQFAQAFAPRPVFYRSSDWRSHEFARLEGQPSLPEPNPMLGLRGTLSYQINSALFEVELAALKQLQQAGFSNISLVLPFVRTVEEFRFCRQHVERVGLLHTPHFQLWIMAEVPSVLLLLPDYIAAGVQGIAIGSNDLTQLLLGVDRDQPQLASAFDPCHPVVMRAIQQLIQTARQANIPCSICGQAPGQSPAMVDALIRWGITAISVEPGAIAGVHQAIERAEQRLLLEAARQRLS